MAGKAKFDREAAFKSIVGADRQSGSEPGATVTPVVAAKNKGRVQRSYFLDRDIDKALRRMALEEETNLTETINKILRERLKEYL
mgnify:CR=1 FL=1|jgi:hypothetical protein